MRTLSTHVLDSVTGRPAAGMTVRLDVAAEPEAAACTRGEFFWTRIGVGVTDPDGRLKSWADTDTDTGTDTGTGTSAGTDVPLTPGQHRLTFDTGGWFADQHRECFYPEVAITFTVAGEGHYHVPLLLAPFGYSTYRGS